MLVGLIGDLEGEVDAAVRWLRVLGQRGDVRVAYQLGDLRFGMGPEPEDYLAAIDAVCAQYDLRLYGINGNHENWAELDRLWSAPPWVDAEGHARPIEITDRVTLLPRGHRWTLGGRSFVALGGAPSINRHLLAEGVDWWPSEVLLDEHVDAVVAGGYADVMLTHDSPHAPYCTPAVAEILRRNADDNPMGWPEESLVYAEEGMAQMTRAVRGVRPRLLAHGHFHVAGEGVVRLPGADGPTTVWSLAARHDGGTVRVLDLGTLTEAPAPSAELAWVVAWSTDAGPHLWSRAHRTREAADAEAARLRDNGADVVSVSEQPDLSEDDVWDAFVSVFGPLVRPGVLRPRGYGRVELLADRDRVLRRAYMADDVADDRVLDEVPDAPHPRRLGLAWLINETTDALRDLRDGQDHLVLRP